MRSGTLDDIFEVQERVSREIVRALGVRLTSDENRRLAERPIADVRAFELFLQARQEVRRFEANALERAAILETQVLSVEGRALSLDGVIPVLNTVKLGVPRELDLDAVAEELLADPRVETVSRNWIYRSHGETYPSPEPLYPWQAWHLEMVDAPAPGAPPRIP